MTLVHSSYGCWNTLIPTTNITIKPHLPLSLLPLLSPTSIKASGRRSRTLLHASPENLAPAFPAPRAPAPDGEKSSEPVPSISAADVVRNFYGSINRRDLSSVEGLIAQNCVYEDLVFPSPFVGREAIMEFFEKFTGYSSTDLQFVIDAISEEDSSAVGVTWHLEWKGKPFPFSKGCSLYRLEVVNGIRQITYGRDCVEPAIKPGESVLIIIRGISWLLDRFPGLADWL